VTGSPVAPADRNEVRQSHANRADMDDCHRVSAVRVIRVMRRDGIL
jgi:hypothetical protein